MCSSDLSHIRQFNQTYGINRPGVVDALHKESVFESTLAGKASKWLAEYPVDHFTTFDEGSNAFLRRFRVEKTISQHIEKLRTLEQKRHTVEDYAARFNMLLQRIPAASQPTDEILNDYFLRGLARNLWTALATLDKSTTTLDNVKQQAILAGETLLGDLSDSRSSRRNWASIILERNQKADRALILIRIVLIRTPQLQMVAVLMMIPRGRVRKIPQKREVYRL